MSISPNAYALSQNGKGRGKRLFRDKAGRLLVPDRIWIATTHIISMVSEEPTLSNIFYALRLRDEEEAKLKALCLWFNTTWGILTVLTSREETRGGWIRLKMSQWRMVPVLHVNKLPEEKVNQLAEVFDRFKDIDLSRIPEQYDPNGKATESRMQLDLSFLKALGIHAREEELLSLYSEVSSSLKQWLG